MFTGLVAELGKITAITRGESSSVLTVHAPLLTPELSVGDSIAVNGTCLTATSLTADSFTADVMVQTLSLTSLGELAEGSAVNLELAAQMDMRMGGHIVQGHVDGIATVISRTPGEKWEQFIIEVPSELSRYIVNQGSICVDGVSLTVGEINDANNQVTLWLIPETLAKTNLSLKAAGDIVNIEVDILAKYVERLISKGAK
ncbi:MAG: riboflavin synthase [Candidatus Planktophila sp.]|nr:riboflavin synthase [Candidatus Planktophila sp.]